MKTNFLSKLFYIFFVLLGMQYAYSDTVSFDFLYADSKIQNVTFVESQYEDYAIDIDKYSSNFSVSTLELGGGYRVTVNMEGTNNGSSVVAENFNWISDYFPNYDSSQVMEVGGSEMPASSLDFWVIGNFYINGKLVDDVFTLAHNNHNNSVGANDWWITSASTTPARYESGDVVKLNLKDVEGTAYCLNQNANNYQVVVSQGACTSDVVTPESGVSAKHKELHFQYESGIESVEFVYDGKYGDTGSVPGVGSDYDKYGRYEVVVSSKLDANSNTATSFNDKFGSESTVSSYEIKLSNGTTSTPTPKKLNFWVEGKLYINGILVSSDFTIGQDGNWWLGTNSGQNFTNSAGYVNMNLDNNQYCLYPMDSDSVAVFKGACTIYNKPGDGPLSPV